MTAMQSVDFDYTVKRSSRRRTAAIMIDGGEVQVRVPMFADDRWIANWVASKADWVRPRLNHQQNAYRKHGIDLSSRKLPVDGVLFSISDHPSGREAVSLDLEGRALRVKTSFGLEQCDANWLETKIKNRLRRYATQKLTRLVEEQVGLIGTGPSSVEVRSYKRKWGQCSSSGKVSLNWRCIHLPEALQRYVVTHELCHLTEMNHSHRFWSLVQQYCPEYIEQKQQLRQFGPYLDF